MNEDGQALRTFRSGRDRDYGLFVIIVIFGAMGPYQITDELSLWPLHWLAAIYLGYRMGRWHGLAAGLLMTLPWWLANYVESFESLDEVGRLLSFQDLLISAALGWISGWIFDRLDQSLSSVGIDLSTYLTRPRDPFIQWLFVSLGRVLSQGSEKPGSTGIRFVKMLSVFGRGSGAILLLPGILVILNLRGSTDNMDAPWGIIELSAFPFYTAATLIIIAALASGNRHIVFFVPLVWALSKIVASSISDELDLPDFHMSLYQPANAIGLAILVWFAALAGSIWKLEEGRTKLAQLTQDSRRKQSPQRSSPLTFVFVMILFCFTLSFEFEGFSAWAADIEDIIVTGRRYTYVFISFQAALFGLLLILGYFRDGKSTSNRVMILLVFLAIVHFQFDIGDVTIGTLSPTMSEILVLGLAPLIGSTFDLRQLSVCLATFRGYLILSLVTSIYLGGYLDTDMGINRFVLLSLALQIALVETYARVVHWVVSRPETGKIEVSFSGNSQ